MQPSSFHYFPLSWPFLLALFVLLLIAIAVIELRILKYAYERMGIPPRYALLILLLSLFGSQVNIPVAELQPEEVMSDRIVESRGMRYIVPAVKQWPRTIIAVNVGGALIPVLLSAYLLIKNDLYICGLIGVTVVAVIVHFLAEPVRGVGITVPTLLPPVLAAMVGMILAWRQAAPLAYIAGTLGTLIGADLLNLDKIQGLGAPIASIGGAGTFDGIFVTGILAVLLAPATGNRVPDKPPHDGRAEENE